MAQRGRPSKATIAAREAEKSGRAPATVTNLPTATPAPVAVVEYDWDSIPEPTDIVYTRVPGAGREPWDGEAETPVMIKRALKLSFDQGLYNSKSGKFDAKKKWLELGDKAKAEAFCKLARKYAAFKEWTFRGAVAEDGRLTYSVKPRETRTRKLAAA